MPELGQLFRQGRDYGRVNLFTSRDGTYSCTITFDTVEHVSLDARSSYNHTTPEAAMTEAIRQAQAIVASVAQKFGNLKKIGLA